MKRILVLVVSLLLLSGAVSGQSLKEVKPYTATASLTTSTCVGGSLSSTGCIGVNMGGYQHISYNLTGTWTGTVTFECSGDGTNFVVHNVFPASGTQTAVTTATANGLFGNWTQPIIAFSCRARFSTPTSGTVVVNVRATQ